MSLVVFEEWFLAISITLLIAYMGYIVWDLAKKSNAGKMGTTALFLALGLGCAGFVIKAILVETMNL